MIVILYWLVLKYNIKINLDLFCIFPRHDLGYHCMLDGVERRLSEWKSVELWGQLRGKPEVGSYPATCLVRVQFSTVVLQSSAHSV